MAFRFDLVKCNHVVLFLLHSLGGSIDMARLFLLLYLSDVQHLSRFGTLITGDSYMALKNGPAPFHLMSIMKQMQDGNTKDTYTFRNKLHITITDKKQVSASAQYNFHHLADSEVECMFSVIRRYKNMPSESIAAAAKDKAWQSANINGEISIADMAAAGGASEEMIAYITQSNTDEFNAFDKA